MAGLQAHDIVPKGMMDEFGRLFRDRLPGWAIDRDYNYRISAPTQIASLQLNSMLHSGNHNGLNKAIKELLRHPDFINLSDDAKTKQLAKLVNFMSEAQGVGHFNSATSKTGGYVAFTNNRDPVFVSDYLKKQPVPGSLGEYHAKYLTWGNITASQAAKDVDALNVRVANGKLVYDGSIKNGGFFSVAHDLIDRTPSHTISKSSQQYSKEYVEKNGIKGMLDGSITKNGDLAMSREDAKKFVDRKLPDGHYVKDAENIPKKWMKFAIDKLSVVAIVAVLGAAAFSAGEAQAAGTYDTEKPNDANKNFLSEIVGLAVGSLVGFVGGALAGVASFGALTIPTFIVLNEIGERVGKAIANQFYDLFPSTGNGIAEHLVTFFDPAVQAGADLVEAIYAVVSDVSVGLYEAFFGADGLFGVNGPIFGEGGPLHILTFPLYEKGILTEGGVWAWEGFDYLLEGTDQDDVLIHEGYGEVHAGKGDDILVGWLSEFKGSGDPIFEEEDSPVAEGELRLILDGGEGDDIVLAFGGRGAILAGGEGKDWLFNTSFKGQLYGDTVDGLDGSGRRLGEADKSKDGRTTYIDRGAAHSDSFWFWPGTFIMDAGREDHISYFGLPLTGGTNMPVYGGSIWSIAAFVAATVQAGIAIDWVTPWVFYSRTADNQLIIIDCISGALGIGPADMQGRMVVEDYDFGNLTDPKWNLREPAFANDNAPLRMARAA